MKSKWLSGVVVVAMVLVALVFAPRLGQPVIEQSVSAQAEAEIAGFQAPA